MSTVDERLVAEPVPLWEVPGWRQRFGVTAGITGRGGDPAAPFDLGLWTERPVREVMERWRRFRRQLPGFSGWFMAHQVHGDRIVWHGCATAGWTVADGADGHATRLNGQLLLVTVADCIPVYLVARRTRAIALLHAGWRGTAARIVERGLQVLHEHAGAEPADIVMHAGVGICGRCYQVGSEVMTALGAKARGAGPWQLDLRDTLLDQAASAGVAEVSASSLCTACHRDRFFSHRGSGGSDGRMVAYLGLDPT